MTKETLIKAVEDACTSYKDRFGFDPEIYDIKMEGVGDGEFEGYYEYLGIVLSKAVRYKHGGFGSKTGNPPHAYINFEFFSDEKTGQISDRNTHTEFDDAMGIEDEA